MEVNKLKAVRDSLQIAIELLNECKLDTRLLEVQIMDIEEMIESESFRSFSKLNKMVELNQNQEKVLDKLKEINDDYIISTIVKFSDYYIEDTEIENAFTSLNDKEELEVVESFSNYLRSRNNVN